MARESLWGSLEDAVAHFLDGRPFLTNTARVIHRFGKRNALRILSIGRSVTTESAATPTNIFHASIQRTGSRWIRTVFSDPRIRKHTGLRVYPQHEYEIGEFHDSFPRYTFVPGLYVNYEQYVRVDKPNFYRTFYVTREPRNVVLSWYRSMKNTHRLVNDSVRFFRNRLSSLEKEEGIKEAIRLYLVKLSYMRDWVQQAESDPDVFVVKMEEMTGHSVESFRRIFNHCQIDIPQDVLESVLGDYDKSGMRRRNDRRRKGEKSDYRDVSKNWRREFTERHHSIFREVNGNLVELLEYGN